MGLAGRLQILQLNRLFQLGTVSNRQTPAIAGIGCVDLADRIIVTTDFQGMGSNALSQNIADSFNAYAFNLHGFQRNAIGNGQNGRTVEQRRNRFMCHIRIKRRNRAQQCTQICIVPCFDTTARQTVDFQSFQCVITGAQNFCVTRQITNANSECIKQSILSRCSDFLRMDVHIHPSL